MNTQSPVFTGAIIGRLKDHDEFFHLETIAQPMTGLKFYALVASLLRDYPQIEEIQLNMGRSDVVRESV